MKRINLFAGVLFVLAGFCAGIGFNLFSTNIEAQGGPPEPPPAALKVVAHDATLTGNGTTVAPLGIADRAITPRKLSAAAVPSVGQVLGFNGANLAWQNASVGGVRVVDSLGQDVGPYLQGPVLRKVGALTFLISLSDNGFGFALGGTLQFHHASPDCSGPRYLTTGDGLVRTSLNVNDTLFYASDPVQPITISSREDVTINGSNQSVVCIPFVNSYEIHGGVATSFDLSTLGLTPPFHLEF